MLVHPDQRRGLPCIKSTAAGHNARPGSVALGTRSQGRLALQPQLVSLKGTPVGYAVHVVAWRWYGAPLRAGVSRPVARVVVRAGDVLNTVCLVPAHRNVRSRGMNLSVARRVRVAIVVRCSVGACLRWAPLGFQ